MICLSTRILGDEYVTSSLKGIIGLVSIWLHLALEEWSAIHRLPTHGKVKRSSWKVRVKKIVLEFYIEVLLNVYNGMTDTLVVILSTK